MPRSKPAFKKRVFKGNQHNPPTSPRPSFSGSSNNRGTNTPNVDRPRPQSASSKKVSPFLKQYQLNENDESENCIVNIGLLNEALSNVSVCKNCHGQLVYKVKHIVGLASKIIVSCSDCENTITVTNSELVRPNTNQNEAKSDRPNTFYDLNLRLVYAMRNIGKGRVAAEKICAFMNLTPPPLRYHEHEHYLGSIAELVCKKSMQSAVQEAVSDNDGCRDLAIAADGSWQKRGHLSLNGVVSVTSLSTGKVLDIEILSKYCRCTNRLNNTHGDGCIANFEGSSGAMEVAGAVAIFQRSQALYEARYLEYLGDGDSKAYSSVCEAKPYGDTAITKIECIGHVQKRMGSRLKNLKAKTKTLPDGSRLGGKNKLTDSAIIQLQKYYGLAIRRNTNSVEDMKKAIWAEFFHVMSSNERPQHGLCPDDEETWCKYRKAVKSNENYDHGSHFHLPENLMTFIKPIFQDLANPTLLGKCTKGKTQNPNESLNNVIWTYIPKRTFVEIKTLKFGIYEAVTAFNDGYIGKCKVFQEIGVSPGQHFITAMKKLDRRRIWKAEKAQEDIEKKIRQKKNLLKRSLEDEYEEQEGDQPAYAPGMY
uniref:Mutator-like transposase domain-containing protein n=1 Tax=Homalodisca liturata TaxID=320908 RepID=A0A1B6JDH1_9HEMI